MNIILIDEKDNITGYNEKSLVHREGLLHRAFSIFILNSKKELLIQQRKHDKYHSGGLWSNTCCGHFTSGIDMVKQAEKRLHEEMGIHCQLNWIFNYRYSVLLNNGLKENELVYAYSGFCDENPLPDREEVNDWRWVNLISLKEDQNQNPQQYTFWFTYSFNDLYSNIYK